jgi:hypothetical protein
MAFFTMLDSHISDASRYSLETWKKTCHLYYVSDMIIWEDHWRVKMCDWWPFISGMFSQNTSLMSIHERCHGQRLASPPMASSSPTNCGRPQLFSLLHAHFSSRTSTATRAPILPLTHVYPRWNKLTHLFLGTSSAPYLGNIPKVEWLYPLGLRTKHDRIVLFYPTLSLKPNTL